MDAAKRQRVRDLIRDTKRTLRHGAGICARTDLVNLSAKLHELADRWDAEVRDVGRPMVESIQRIAEADEQ